MEIEILPFKIQGAQSKMIFSLFKIQGAQSKWNSPLFKIQGAPWKKKLNQNMLKNINV